jgi:hypothetical protein
MFSYPKIVSVSDFSDDNRTTTSPSSSPYALPRIVPLSDWKPRHIQGIQGGVRSILKRGGGGSANAVAAAVAAFRRRTTSFEKWTWDGGIGAYRLQFLYGLDDRPTIATVDFGRSDIDPNWSWAKCTVQIPEVRKIEFLDVFDDPRLIDQYSEWKTTIEHQSALSTYLWGVVDKLLKFHEDRMIDERKRRLRANHRR